MLNKRLIKSRKESEVIQEMVLACWLSFEGVRGDEGNFSTGNGGEK